MADRSGASSSSSSKAETLRRLLDNRADPLTRVLDNAPFDDELTAPEEEAAVQEGFEAAARGETISREELRAEFR